MPTGYTHQLAENASMSFADFTWACARQFGAFINQKDASMNAPSVLKEEPSSYHAVELKDATRKLAMFKKLNNQRKHRWAELKLTEELNSANESIASAACTEYAYKAMLDQVEGWQPPTKDHQGLKDFMIQQLVDSIKRDGIHEYKIKIRMKILQKSPEQQIEEHIKSLQADIEYHKKHLAEDTKQIDARNKWKQDLVNSIGLPSSMEKE